jgi:tetratricopeptide (TPR) repeat protein
MQNNSIFVKIVIWSMVFLMSIGFIGLVIAPFVGNTNLFGGDARSATEEQLEEAQADVKKDDCADEKQEFSGAKLERCKEALQTVASAYTTLAQPEEGATEVPRDSQRNIDRAGDAFQRLYEIDKDDDENAALYAGFLRDTGKSEQALTIWTALVKKNPNDEDYLLQQAGGYAQTQQLDKAIATLRLYIKKFPDSGQIESIREEIKSLQEQQKQQAAGGGAGVPGGAPITVG